MAPRATSDTTGLIIAGKASSKEGWHLIHSKANHGLGAKAQGYAREFIVI